MGEPIVSIETPQPRHAMDRWPERLDGSAVPAWTPTASTCFIRFEGDLTLHSHLRMTGWWGVYPHGRALAPVARGAPGS